MFNAFGNKIALNIIIINCLEIFMGIEIDLMKNYPKTKRDPFARLKSKTDQHRQIAQHQHKCSVQSLT